MEYAKRLERTLNAWTEEAVEVGDKYLDVNVPGLSEISVNAHNLNSYISLLRTEGGIQNKDLLKLLAITCARLAIGFERAEEEQAKAQEEEKAKSEKKATKSKEPAPANA